jgi:PqqA peptide cyclase
LDLPSRGLICSDMVHKPLGLLAELTHRCPLGCPYCSNPLALDERADELDTTTWLRVFREAAKLGVLQMHLSGGEPGARRDLVDITAGAHATGLYTNLITSAVGITDKTLGALAEAGLDHVQISSRTATLGPPTTSPAIRAHLPGNGHSRPRSCDTSSRSP